MTERQKQTILELVAAGLGGVLGALATRWLERAGLRRTVAAIGLTAAGGVTAVLTRGTVRAAATGVAAGASGELVSIWFAALESRIRGASHRAEPPRDAGPMDEGELQAAIDRAFERKRSTDRGAKKPRRRSAAPATATPVVGSSEPATTAPESEPTPSPVPDNRPLIIKEPIGGIRMEP